MKKGMFIKILFSMLLLALPLSANVFASNETITTVPEANIIQINTNQSIAEDVSTECSTGTLLFSQGDCLSIRCYTWSPYTHVAIVVMKNDQPVVYDSMNGVGVRCLPLNEYIKWEGYSSGSITLMNPIKPLTEKQGETLERYLDSQIGRTYSVKHYLTGNENKGIHCSEYVSIALMESNIIKVERPAKVSPASLYEGVSTGNLYDVRLVSNLIRPVITRGKGKSWYNQAWLDTKYCYNICHFRVATWALKSK